MLFKWLAEGFLAKQPSLMSCLVWTAAMDQDHAPQESGRAINPRLASAATVAGPTSTAGSAWRKGHGEGRLIWAALTLEAPRGYSPLVSGEKEEMGSQTGVTSSPKRWVRAKCHMGRSFFFQPRDVINSFTRRSCTDAITTS